MFYQWIYNFNQSIWMLAQFDADGDTFTLSGNPKRFRIVNRERGIAVVEYDNFDDFKGEVSQQALIKLGDLVESPIYTPNS